MKIESADIQELLRTQGHLKDLEAPKARLKGVQLEGAVLTHAKLAGADLTGANLAGADLSHADLSGATLNGANLSRAIFDHADLRKARLRKADLTGAILTGAQLHRAVLPGASLSDADFTGADLSDADLSEISLERTLFTGARMQRANLGQATLTGADLSGALLEEAFLERATFVMSNLERVDLTRANLVGFTLRQPSGLQGAIFREADLAEATLEAVSFAGVDLAGSILDQVQLKEVSFEGATLSRADFQGVSGLTPEQILAIRAAGGVVNAVFFEKIFGFVRGHRAAQIVLAVLLVAGLAVGAVYYRNPAYRPVDSLMAEAQTMRKEGKAEEALKIYEMLLPRVKDRLDQEISVLYEKAETLTELNRSDEAAAIYALISTRTSNDRDESINAQLKRAGALTEAEKYDAAVQIYRAIAEDATNSPRDVARALVAMSQAYQKQGYEDKALDIFQETLKRFPHDPEIALEVNLEMAEVYIQRQRYDQADKLLEQLGPLVQDDSQRAALLIKRARLYERMENKEKALATFAELVKRYPDNPDVSPDVKMDLAQLMADKGEANRATRIFKDIIEHAQDRLLKSKAQIQYGTLLRQLGKTDEALELFRLVRKQATDNNELQGSAALEEVETLVALKKYSEALTLLDEIIASPDPSMSVTGLLRRGQVLLEMGKVEEAQKVFQQVTDKGKGEASASAWMDMAQAFSAGGNFARAVSIYEQVARDPSAGAFRGNILNNLGQSYLDMDNLPAAEKTFNELLKMTEDEEALANGRFGLARLALRRGDRVGAVALYQQVAKEVADQNIKAIALDSLARLYSDNSNVGKAIEVYQSILEVVPAMSDEAFSARQSMADQYAARKEFDKAEKQYRSIIETAQKGDIQAGSMVALGRMFMDKFDGSRDKADLDKAMELFQQVLARHTTVPDAPYQARLGIAEVFKLRGDNERAIQAYQKLAADAKDPASSSQVMDALVQLYQDNNQPDLALQLSQQMIDKAGQDPEAIFNARVAMAGSLRQKGDFKKALDIYSSLKASTTDRNLKLTVIDALAQTWSAMGQQDQAATAYEQIVNEYKDNLDILYNAMMGLAGARHGQAKNPEALALYQRVAQESTDKGLQSMALESMAQIYIELGQPDKAAEVTRRAGSSAPDGATTSKMTQADSLRSQKDYVGALKLYDEVAATDKQAGNQAWALVYAGQILTEQDKNDNALDRYLKVIEKYPNEAEPVLTARMGVAGIYRARNRLKEATARYEEIARGDGYPDYRINAALTAAELYLEQDQRPKAKATYEQLLKRYPDQVEAAQGAKLGLARVALDSGQGKDALAAYRAVETGTTDRTTQAAALSGQALSYLNLGDKAKARDMIRTLKSRFPDLVPDWVGEKTGPGGELADR